MATYAAENPEELEQEWNSIDANFQDFQAARSLDGTWKLIHNAQLPPDLHPTLKESAQGLHYMTGMLQEDFRILKILHAANPTLIDTQVRGSTQAARNLERDFKLTWASWWDNDLNEGRWLDSWVYEGQIGLGLTVPWLRWKKQDNGDGTSGCPVYIEETLVEAVRWHGDFRNPSVGLLRYSVSMLDCDMKNAKGERPYYQDGEVIGWTSEMLSRDDYKANANKKVDIIVRDAEDYMAMCPLAGCHHKKRRITIYVCKPGGKAEDYEEVQSYDSPFARCSFIIVGGDVHKTERDPHRQLRPSAWILLNLVLQYNMLFNSLLAAFARELDDRRLYENVGGSDPNLVSAVHGDEDSGQSDSTKIPELASDEIYRMAGTVQQFPKPSLTELMELLKETIRQYEMYRPNRNLTGQAAVSEVTGTAAVLQNQGAGMMLSEDLVNWDSGHKRMFHETVHAIRFTSHFEDDDEQTRYIATVSGRENVKGSRGGARPGDTVYLDAKKCETPVSFSADTSKDTPADRRDREERARTAKAAGIFTDHDVFRDYGIFDPEMQEELLFAERIEKFLQPLEDQRVAMLVAARSASRTGVDLGEEQLAQNLPPVEENVPQEHNTMDANAARRHAPPVELPSTTPAGMGGSSGLV